MRRDHRFTQRAMPDALDQTLTPRQRARFAQHVEDCPQCGPMLRGLIRVRIALRMLNEQPEGVEGSIVRAVLGHLQAHAGEQRSKPPRWLRRRI